MSPVAIASASARSRAIPTAPYLIDKCDFAKSRRSFDGIWDDELGEWACQEGVCYDCECYEEESDELESEASSWGSTLSTCSSGASEDVDSLPPTLTRRRSLFEDQAELYETLLDSYDKTAAPCCPSSERLPPSQSPKLRPPIPLTFTKIDPLLRPGQSQKVNLETSLESSPRNADPIAPSPSLLSRSLQYFSFSNKSTTTPEPLRSIAKLDLPDPAPLPPRNWDEESEVYTVSVMLQTFNARSASKPPPMRPVVNSAQFRMQALEGQMINKGKISAPLRQRNYRWRRVVQSALRRSGSCLSVGNTS